MIDISTALKDKMQKEKCSSFHAFLLLSEKEEDNAYLFQPKSCGKSCRFYKERRKLCKLLEKTLAQMQE